MRVPFQADQAPGLASSMDGQDQTVRTVGRARFLSNGIWMDTAYDPDKMKPQQVSFLSKEYFELAQSRAGCGRRDGAGRPVIIMVDGLRMKWWLEGVCRHAGGYARRITPAAH